jgi:hypothetical protein
MGLTITKSAVRSFKMRRILDVCRDMKKVVVACAEVIGEILLALVLDDYGIDDYGIPKAETEIAVKALISEERGREKAVANAEARPA